MTGFARGPVYCRHGFSADVTSDAVCVYFRFSLRLRMAGNMLAARGIIASHRAARLSAAKFYEDASARRGL